MKNWEDDDSETYCASREDLVDAAAVADVVGIDIQAVNFARQYRERVFAQFLSEYRAGRTPNPDVLCNSEIKFNAFLDHALALGAERIATGHYAQLRAPRAASSWCGRSTPRKDQTYFLHRLDQRQLAPTLFPLGQLHEERGARDRPEQKLPNAREEGLHGHLLHRREARFATSWPAICRARRGRSKRPRAHRRPTSWAWPTTRSASGRASASAACAALRPARGSSPTRTRRATRSSWCRDMATRSCYARTLEAGAMHWIAGRPPASGSRLACKTRYRMADAPCRLDRLDDGSLARHLRRRAVGADAGPVSGRLRRRALPGWGSDPGARAGPAEPQDVAAAIAAG